MKYQVVSDLFDVLDIEGQFDSQRHTVGGFDLIWQDGPVAADLPDGMLCTLGCRAGGAEKFASLTLPLKTRGSSGAANAHQSSPASDAGPL